MQQGINRHSKYNELPHYSVEQSISTHQWFASHAVDFEESIFDARIPAQHQTLTALIFTQTNHRCLQSGSRRDSMRADKSPNKTYKNL
jgi:hypothetical protein